MFRLVHESLELTIHPRARIGSRCSNGGTTRSRHRSAPCQRSDRDAHPRRVPVWVLLQALRVDLSDPSQPVRPSQPCRPGDQAILRPAGSRVTVANDPARAKVAELADALDLGSSGRKAVGVRLPPFALQQAHRRIGHALHQRPFSSHSHSSPSSTTRRRRVVRSRFPGGLTPFWWRARRHCSLPSC
jgi:hypothetical protein